MSIKEKIEKHYILASFVMVIVFLLITFCTIWYFSEVFICEKFTHTPKPLRFNVYFQYNDMNIKIANLKQGLDDISADYIDQFMKNSKCWTKCANYCLGCQKENLWSKNDKKLFKEYENEDVPEIYAKADFNFFKYKNSYGMKDLPKDVIDNIDGKDILDLGAWPGDSTYILHKLFPHSNIFAYEPIVESYNEMNMFFDEMKKEDSESDLIHPVNKSVGFAQYKAKISNNDRTNFSDMVSLDYEYPKIKKNSLGLIKMDVEGFESDIVEGGANIIKQYKPVLIIAICYSPQVYFEMKDKLKELNPDYKFLIRRSSDVYVDGGLVLIAY